MSERANPCALLGQTLAVSTPPPATPFAACPAVLARPVLAEPSSTPALLDPAVLGPSQRCPSHCGRRARGAHGVATALRLVGWAHGAAHSTLGPLLLTCWGLSSTGCDERPPQAGASAPSASHKSQPAAPESPRLECREAKAGARFMIGDVGKTKQRLASEEGTGIDLPFAVEVGSAVQTSDGFALSALKGNSAVVAFVARDGGQGTEFELEQVHGDVEPPKLASDRDRLVAAVVDNDAGGTTLTLVAIQRAAGETAVSRGAPIQKGREGSGAFDLALGSAGGLIVWDRWDKPHGHGVIEGLAFQPATLDAKRPLMRIELGSDDAESPRVLARAGGFWLVWVSHGAPRLPTAAGRASGSAAPARVNPASVASGLPEASDEASVIDLTPRRLKVALVDEYGQPIAEPRLLSAPDAHVLAYDALAVDDGLTLAWRDDPTTLGVEAPTVHVAHVTPDGSVKLEVIEDERLRAGTPRLFLDKAVKARAMPWLSVIGEEGQALIGLFEAPAKLQGPLQEVTGLGFGEPLALNDTRLLLARPNGQALDVIVVGCERKTAR